MSAALAAALNPGTQTPENESASVVPGSASGSRGHPARDRHWPVMDFDNMRCAELRRAALALVVYSKSQRDSKTLRAKCKAAVAGQGTLLRYAVVRQENAHAPDVHATAAPPGPANDCGAPSSNPDVHVTSAPPGPASERGFPPEIVPRRTGHE